MKWLTPLLIAALCSFSNAQWSANPDSNSWIPKGGYEQVPLADTDGEGGVIVAWDENFGYGGIWANRVDKHGYYRWGLNGVRVSPPGGSRNVTNVISDGRSGALIVWDDYSKSDPSAQRPENEIYVQRIDSTGRILWNASGVLIRARIPQSQCGDYWIVTSDHNTFIISWNDDRRTLAPDPYDFYAQRIDLDGKLYWQANGKRLNEETNVTTGTRRVIEDSENGFLMVWFNPAGQQDVIVDRFSRTGEMVWSQGHVHANTGGAFEAVTDGQGGVIVVGAYFPGGGFVSQGRIQRIDRNGCLCWSDSALVFLRNKTQYLSFVMIPTIASGTIVSWSEDVPFDLSPKRHFWAFDSTGRVKWRNENFRYGHSSINHPIPLSDGFGGMTLLINDYEKSRQIHEGHQVALRIDVAGNATWSKEGVLFRHRTFDDWPFELVGVADGQGGVIVVWEDGHPGTFSDIALQQINAAGQLGQVLTSVKEHKSSSVIRDFIVKQNYPNPFNPVTQIVIETKQPVEISCRIFDVSGKEVITLLDKKRCLGKEMIKWQGQDRLGNRVSSGIYFYEVASGRQGVAHRMLLVK